MWEQKLTCSIDTGNWNDFLFHLPRVNTVFVDDNYSSVHHPQSEKQG